MRITPYYNIYTNQASDEVVNEIVARMDALSALNRNVSPYASSKQFFAVRDSTTAKPELLRKFQEWRDTKVAFGEVRAFRRVSKCCKGYLKKELEAAPFLVSVMYDDENNMVPGSNDKNGTLGKLSYADIKYSVSDGLNKPSFYNGQPQAFLQSVSVSNEGYGGSVQKVRIRMRVFTREAFEVIDKWFLRPGNEMLVKFGWSIPLSSVDTATEVIHAVIFNFNATLTDDMGWDVTIHGIAKGNVAVGLNISSAGIIDDIFQSNTNQSQQPVAPNLTAVLAEELNRLRMSVQSLQDSDNSETETYDDIDSQGFRSGILYDSYTFPHGIGRVKFKMENIEQFTEPVDTTANTTSDEAVSRDPNNTKAASDSEYELFIKQLSNSGAGAGIFSLGNPSSIDWEEANKWDATDIFGNSLYSDVIANALKNKNIESGDRGATLLRFFVQNFGYVNPTLKADYLYPDPESESYNLLLYQFYEKPQVFQSTRATLLAGPGIGAVLEVFDFSGSSNSLRRRLGIFNAKDIETLIPTPGLRRRVWEEMLPYIKLVSAEMKRQSLTEDQKDALKKLEEENKKILESLETQAAQSQQKIDEVINAQQPQRITDPQSKARYYICLGDLVYFFNEKVFSQAPEFYEAVQLLVENQITTYDPNLVSYNPTEVIFSNALNDGGGMSRYGNQDYGFKYRRVGASGGGVIYNTEGTPPQQQASNQGVIAYTGNTGNSTGPHLHVGWSDKTPIDVSVVDQYIRLDGHVPSKKWPPRDGQLYGPRTPVQGSRKPISKFHRGVDIGCPTGTAITLVNGAVFTRYVGYQDKGAGHYIEVAIPDGRRLILMHLREPPAAAGNAVQYGYNSSGNMELVLDTHGDGAVFYDGDEFNSSDDMPDHVETWGINHGENLQVAAFNIAHIWISVDIINEIYVSILKDNAVDPQYKTVLTFFEYIFAKIADASGGVIQLSILPDVNELYQSAKAADSINIKATTPNNPLLKQTHMLRIVDVNYQLPHNIGPKTLAFKVNDVNTTILRDVNVTMKLPSRMQTVAYTFGRQGLNGDIIDLSEDGGICQTDNEKLIDVRNQTYNTLNYWKDRVGVAATREHIENLQNALIEYVKNPTPISSGGDDTANVQYAHQGWIFSRLYPVELQLKLDGISGFMYGNKIEVLNALPSRYNDVLYFTLTKIEHEVSNNDWITTLTAIARLKYSNQQLQFPTVINNKEECGGAESYVPVSTRDGQTTSPTGTADAGGSPVVPNSQTSTSTGTTAVPKTGAVDVNIPRSDAGSKRQSNPINPTVNPY